MNKVFLLGRLAQPVNYNTLEKGTRIANYSLAVPIKGKKDQVDYINCTAFNDAADFANQYLKKGMRILVEAHLKSNNYTNKNNAKVYTQEVIIEHQYFADGTGKFGITEEGLFASIADDDPEEVPDVPDVQA